MPRRNAAPLALVTILVMEALLVGLASVHDRLPSLPLGAEDSLQLKFASLERAFHFGPRPTNAQADTMLQKLWTQRDSLSEAALSADQNQPKDPRDTSHAPLLINSQQDSSGRRELDKFFAALYELEQDSNQAGLVRIAHYGDSQIEGDRISRYLRKPLQQRFGGNGLGYVPIQQPANHHSLRRSVEGDWQRYTVFKNHFEEPHYGLGGMVFRFADPKEEEDSAASPPPTPQHASKGPPRMALEWTPKHEEEARPARGNELKTARVELHCEEQVRYEQARLLWGKAPTAFRLKVYAHDSLVQDSQLEPGGAFHRTALKLPANTRHIRLVFEARKSPEIFGLAFDPAHGLQVDNYGIRGHSGTGLLRIEDELMAEQFRRNNTRLIVLQYGGNVVPADHIESWDWLQRRTYQLIRKLQRAAPEASILVMSVADAAHKVDGTYQSWATVPKIRRAQRRAAKRAGVAFWDLYQSMGGRGSIISWVRHDPPLAAHDYAHFSHAGQKLVGTMLIETLLEEYGHFKRRYGYAQDSPDGSANPAASLADSVSSASDSATKNSSRAPADSTGDSIGTDAAPSNRLPPPTQADSIDSSATVHP